MTELKKCFFITPMGEKNSETDLNSKQIIKHLNRLFRKNEVLVQVQRTDQYTKNGIILENIHNQIKDSDLVIADLTGSNPNVTYELGYANAFGKPIIQICASAEFQLPSDIKHIFTLDYDLKDDWSKFAFEQDVLETVEDINFDPDYTPITASLGFSKVGEIPVDQ